MNKFKKAIMSVAPLGALMCIGASAETGPNPVLTEISAQSTQLKTDAVTVIGAGIAIGVVFWGAKLLWSKFKSMAK